MSKNKFYFFGLFVAVLFPITRCTTVGLRAPAGKTVLDKSGYVYDPLDQSCDGFPRVMVETAPGTCLGMVLPRDRAINPVTGKSLVMPRTIVQIPGTKDFIITDMGGWRKNNGGLYILRHTPGRHYEVQNLKSGLNMPHGLAFAPDKFFYVGESHQIVRFRLDKNNKMTDWQIVVKDLPRFEGHMHPLTQFTFDPRNGDLYINSGAPSDHCFVNKSGKDGSYVDCPEVHAKGLAGIYQVKAQLLKNIPPEGIRYYTIIAQGLRNSMAMVVHPSGRLIQGENSRDFSEQEEPYEEINVIDVDNDANQGRNYGWPYCYNFHATSPEWLFPENANNPLVQKFKKPIDCTQTDGARGEYQKPHVLMPPHSAPLHMAYYNGTMFPELQGQLLVSWHGHQPTGQRLVAYDVDEQGLPKLDATNAGYRVNQKDGCPVPRQMKAHGGIDQFANHKEIISGWHAVKNQRPKGAPVGFTVAEDGAIWIVEDRENRTVLRLARSPQTYKDSCSQEPGQNPNVDADYRVSLLAWRNHVKNSPASLTAYENMKTQLVQKYCVGCHGDVKVNDIANDRFSQLDFLVKNEWFVGKDSAHSKMFGAITHNGEVPPMPPYEEGKPQFFGTPDQAKIEKALSVFIDGLPQNAAIEARVKRVVLTGDRRFRDQASTETGKICGQLIKGEIIYIDPRPEAQIKANGWQWAKIYIVPNHSKLFFDKCAYPEDGVFYMALTQL